MNLLHTYIYVNICSIVISPLSFPPSTYPHHYISINTYFFITSLLNVFGSPKVYPTHQNPALHLTRLADSTSPCTYQQITCRHPLPHLTMSLSIPFTMLSRLLPHHHTWLNVYQYISCQPAHSTTFKTYQAHFHTTSHYQTLPHVKAYLYVLLGSIQQDINAVSNSLKPFYFKVFKFVKEKKMDNLCNFWHYSLLPDSDEV